MRYWMTFAIAPRLTRCQNLKNLENTKPMNDTVAVQRVEPGGEITIRQAFEAAASKSLDKESLAVMQELLKMDAEQRFTAAFVALQQEMPTITAKTIIPNRGKYEKFEDLMEVVGPLLTKHGFTVTFSNDFRDSRVIETCHLSYGRHTRSNSFAVRVGRGDDDTQKDLKAATTAKRLALCNALNLVIRQDMQTDENDASLEGDPNAKVTADQADELERRAQLTNSDIPAFLKYAKVTKFADIPARLYTELDQLLARKERQGR
jgi:hypothetical protein